MFYKIVHHVVAHVVPTKHNGFIPRILKAQAMWAMLGIGVALFSFSQILRVTNYLNTAAEVYPASIVVLTNQDRRELGLPPLSVSETLQSAARLKVQHMVDENYFSHTSPSGITPWHWFREAGYDFVYAGENLAVNFSDSDDVQKAWIDSPTHRANIVNSNFTEIGIAIARGTYQGEPTTYVVELFGMPAIAKKNLDTATPVVEVSASAVVPTASVAPAQIGEVAGESVQTPEAALEVVADTESFVSVKNTDPSIEQKSITEPVVPKVSWSAALLVYLEKYAGLLIEIVVVALIMAMATLVTHERHMHHKMHMAYGILMTIILSSSLFVGRMGVFAEARPVFEYPTSQFYLTLK